MTEPLLERPDIGACYCKHDDPDRCHWDRDVRMWVGPCATTVLVVDLDLWTKAAS